MLRITSDSPSWTQVMKLSAEMEGHEAAYGSKRQRRELAASGSVGGMAAIVGKNPLPFDIGLCIRCLTRDSGWQSKVRFSSRDKLLGFDIVVYEEDFVPHKKDAAAQCKIIGAEFARFFFPAMRRYEKQFAELKAANPALLPEIENWLRENGWTDVEAA